MSNSKLIKYKKWLKRVEDAGFNLLAFTAPCCGNELKTIVPETKGTKWDSFAICPYCGEAMLKDAYFDRVVITLAKHPNTQPKTA